MRRTNSIRSSNARGDQTPGDGGRLLALPGTGDEGGTASHLALVDSLLTEVVSDLQHLWTTRLDGDGTAADILGDVDLPALIDRLIRTGGKRIRPVMAYLGWLTASGRSREIGHADVVRAGAALELLHLFALVHDDVMDESATRRGQPTVHAVAARLHAEQDAQGGARRFGESIAILVGDLAHAEADHLAAELPRPMRQIWRLLVVELVSGQRRDLTGTAAGRRDLGHARQVARMKSGGYTVTRPLLLGAAAAQAPGVVHDRLDRYGRELGEAFALRDDLLGIWGDPERTGKPAGDDLLSGKPTVIMSLAEQRVRPAARATFAKVGTSGLGADDVELLQAELTECGVVAEVEELISNHVRTALDALDERALDPDGVTQLTRMAHQIAWRDR